MVIRVTEGCNCCWPSPMSLPGDFVRRFNPQSLSLNRRVHWPAGLTGTEEGGPSQRTQGDRVMDSWARLFCCPKRCRNWPKHLHHWASVLPFPLFPPHHQTPIPHWPHTHTHTVQVSFMYIPCFLLVEGITLSSVLVLGQSDGEQKSPWCVFHLSLMWLI